MVYFAKSRGQTDRNYSFLPYFFSFSEARIGMGFRRGKRESGIGVSPMLSSCSSRALLYASFLMYWRWSSSFFFASSARRSSCSSEVSKTTFLSWPWLVTCGLWLKNSSSSNTSGEVFNSGMPKRSRSDPHKVKSSGWKVSVCEEHCLQELPEVVIRFLEGPTQEGWSFPDSNDARPRSLDGGEGGKATDTASAVGQSKQLPES